MFHIPESKYSAGGDRCGYGVLRCECAEYPVLEGIPILQHVDGLQPVIRRLKEKDTRGALLQAMNVFRVKWAHRSRLHQVRYYMSCRRLVTASLSFEDALQLVRKPNVFADYLLHRYANPSFLADVSLLPILGAFLNGLETERGANGPPRRVLDLGCGAGHSSFLIASLFPNVSVTASDQDFVSLYLAKRFLAPTARYVCTDAEVPSPFPNSHFDAVHCLDAFHYFRSKKAIVAELKRILRPDAFWLFPHLHNALQENVTAGTPLSPEHYARCFEFLNPTLFDEADLLRHLSDIGGVRRYRATAAAELRGAQTVALIGGGGNTVDGSDPESLMSSMCRLGPALRINPIYQGKWQGDTLTLQIRWPNEKLHEECRTVETVLPQNCELRKSELESIRTGRVSDDSRVQTLVSRFVLVPLPPGYSRHNLTANDQWATS